MESYTAPILGWTLKKGFTLEVTCEDKTREQAY